MAIRGWFWPVNGNTDITAPITFDGGSTTLIKSGTTLHLETIQANHAIYDGGLITGAGTFIPAGGLGSNSTEYQNIVQSSSTISTNAFNFGQGGWRIEPGATLTIDVNDYFTFNPGPNVFSSWIAINSGTVNVNTADATALAKALNGIGPAKAKAIVSYREKNGPFKSVDQLAMVEGITQKLIAKNRADIKLGADTSAAPAPAAKPAKPVT